MGSLEDSQSPAWNRRPKESARAYEALRVYLEMGADRSLSAVGKRLGKSSSLIERWSKSWGWVDRAVAFDAHLARESQKAMEKATQKSAEKWRSRAEEQAERKYQVGQNLQNKADKMLALPLTSVTRQDGTTINPGRWNLGHAATLATAGAKLSDAAIQQELGNGAGQLEEEFRAEDYPSVSGEDEGRSPDSLQ